MRFHSKYHFRNHHTLSSSGYPDSASDPIASPDAPFKGDFIMTGTLSANTATFTSPISNLDVGTLSVSNDIISLSVGVLTLTSFANNTDGSNLINVNAAKLQGFTASDFEQVSNKNTNGGYLGIDGSGNAGTSLDNLTLSNLTLLSSLNFLPINDYLTTNDLSSTVAPLVSSDNDYGRELPQEFLPADITTIDTINGITLSSYFRVNEWVDVKQVSDLPTPVSNTITLSSNVNYVFDGLISMPYTLIAQEGTTISGRSPQSDIFNYTGTGNAIEASDSTMMLNNISVMALSGNGLYFTDTTQSKYLNIFTGAFIGCNQAIELSGGNVATLFKTRFLNNDDGISIDGSLNKLALNFNLFEGDMALSSSSMIKLLSSSSILDVDIILNKFTGDVGTFIDVEDPTVLTRSASIAYSRFLGSATYLSGVDFSTKRWVLNDNAGVANTRISGMYTFSDNISSTPTTTQNDWVKITIPTTSEYLAGFTHTSPNRVTYDRSRNRLIHASISLNCESGSNNVDMEAAIFKNGSIISSTVKKASLATANNEYIIPLLGFIGVSESDYIEVYIRNTSGTQAITVDSMTALSMAVGE